MVPELKYHMKRVLTIVILMFSIFIAFAGDKYDVKQIYEKVDLPDGAKAKKKYGSIDDAEYILVPKKLDKGTYKVKVNKLDSNLYEVIGKDIIIETKYCYEYASRKEVILKITSTYGYTLGEIYFDMKDL